MSLKTLQLNFLFWASRWVREDTEHQKPIICDLPEIVCLLEALGYRITKIDTDTNKANLSSPETTEIMKVCDQSGQKYVLESLCEACHRLKPDGDRINENFCEITATDTSQISIHKITQPTQQSPYLFYYSFRDPNDVAPILLTSTSSKIETRTYQVPKIPKELNILIRNVISYFVKVIRKQHAISELLQEETLENRTLSPNENAKELSDYVASLIELSAKPTFHPTREQNITPNRCKSFDTLLIEKNITPRITDVNETNNKNSNLNSSRSNPNIKLKLQIPSSPVEDSVKELNNIFHDIHVSLANAKKLVQTLGKATSTLPIPKQNFEKTRSPLVKSQERQKMKPDTSRTKKIISNGNPSVNKKIMALPAKSISVLEKKDRLKCRKFDGKPAMVKSSPKPPPGSKSLDSRITTINKVP